MAIIGRFGLLTDVVGLKTNAGVQINPAKEDGNLATITQDISDIQEILTFLRIISRELETLRTVDVNNRLRVSIDAAPATLAGVTTVSSVSSVAAVSLVSSVSSVTNIAAFGGQDPRYLFIDTARNAYANGIRSKLT